MTKHVASASLKELLSFSSSKNPNLSLNDCKKILRPALQITSGTELKKWVQSSPEREQAVISILTHLLCRPMSATSEKIESQTDHLALALHAIPLLTDSHSKTLIKEVVLNVAHPDFLRILAAPVSSLIGPTKIERWITEAVSGSNQLHIANALHLIYFVFEASPDVKMNDSTLTLVSKRLKVLQAQNDLNPILRAVIDDLGR